MQRMTSCFINLFEALDRSPPESPQFLTLFSSKMSGTVRILDGLHKVGTLGLMSATAFGFGEFELGQNGVHP